MSVNKVLLLGNLCRDPQIKVFDNGKVAQFSIATNERGFKTKSGKEIPERAEFHQIVITKNGLAEVAEKYLHKGDRVFIEGKLRTRSYADSDNVTRYVTEIHVTDLQMLAGTKHDAPGVVPPPQPEDDMPF